MRAVCLDTGDHHRLLRFLGLLKTFILPEPAVYASAAGPLMGWKGFRPSYSLFVLPAPPSVTYRPLH